MMPPTRRAFLRNSLAVLLSSAFELGLNRTAAAAPTPEKKIKIGFIGAGHMGSTLGTLWAEAGYDIFFSSKNPAELQDLVHRIGSRAQAGTPQQAAQFADILVLAVPYGALPSIGQALAPLLRNKPVLDLCNPYPGRDGKVGTHALQVGAGLATASYFPGARLVRGFNSVDASALQSDAHRKGQPLAIQLASNDKSALNLVSGLVRDAGFAPVVVGKLDSARLFQPEGPLFEKYLPADEMQAQLHALLQSNAPA